MENFLPTIYIIAGERLKFKKELRIRIFWAHICEGLDYRMSYRSEDRYMWNIM